MAFIHVVGRSAVTAGFVFFFVHAAGAAKPVIRASGRVLPANGMNSQEFGDSVALSNGLLLVGSASRDPADRLSVYDLSSGGLFTMIVPADG